MSDTATVEATEATEIKEVPFVDGRRTVVIKDAEFKPRGKGNPKDAAATKADVSILEINSFAVASQAILDAVDGNEVDAVAAVNNLLERVGKSKVYDKLFGDESKIRQLAKSLLAIPGYTEEAAMTQARAIFNASKGEAPAE